MEGSTESLCSWSNAKMLDLFYIGVALLFLAGGWGLVKALDRL